MAWQRLFIKQPEGNKMSSMKELLYQRETAAFMIAERMEEIKQLRSEIDRLRQQIRDVRASLV